MTDLYGDLLLQTKIPQCSAVNKAHMAGRPIFTFDGRSPGAVAYSLLAEELAPRLALPNTEHDTAASTQHRSA